MKCLVRPLTVCEKKTQIAQRMEFDQSKVINELETASSAH